MDRIFLVRDDPRLLMDELRVVDTSNAQPIRSCLGELAGKNGAGGACRLCDGGRVRFASVFGRVLVYHLYFRRGTAAGRQTTRASWCIRSGPCGEDAGPTASHQPGGAREARWCDGLCENEPVTRLVTSLSPCSAVGAHSLGKV